MLEQKSEPTTMLRESISLHQRILDQLIDMTEKITTAEGSTRTIIPFLTIDRHSYQTPINPCVLTPSFCLFLQGSKEIHLGQEIIHSHAGDYSASVIDIPISTQVVDASAESPFIGLRIDFTTKEIASVVMEAEINIKTKDKKLSTGAFLGKSDADLLDLFIRLLKLIDKPNHARFLSALIKREMIFNLLSGDYGHLFFQRVLFDQQADGIGKAIAWIKENYSCPFTVQELAKANNMSTSGLQHKFKTITTMGPLQYQKQLRLQEARRLMLSGSMDATTAALEVGYESPSQFSREYRRLFGQPPHKDINAVKKSSAAIAFNNN